MKVYFVEYIYFIKVYFLDDCYNSSILGTSSGYFHSCDLVS